MTIVPILKQAFLTLKSMFDLMLSIHMSVQFPSRTGLSSYLFLHYFFLLFLFLTSLSILVSTWSIRALLLLILLPLLLLWENAYTKQILIVTKAFILAYYS